MLESTTIVFIVLTVVLMGLSVWLMSQRKRQQSDINQLNNERLELVAEQAKLLEKAHSHESQHLELKEESEGQRQELTRLYQQNAELKTALSEREKKLVEQEEFVQQAKKQLVAEFHNAANQLFQEKTRLLSSHNEKELSQLLQPFREQVKQFSEQVGETYDRESKDRVALHQEIKHLKSLNQQIAQEAVDLTQALKGQSKVQGDWGEVVLERILEQSGLEKGREYETQLTFSNEEQRLRPDVIIRLPGQRDVIVDAKVSLSAYERYCCTEDVKEQNEALKQHIRSLRQHVKGLGSKDYQTLTQLNSLDFVLLFVPIEAAFSCAMREEPELLNEALALNIVLTTPTTLLATLRTIQNLWRLEHQAQNAKDIADKAGNLYDRFVGFIADLEKVGRGLESSQKAYQAAYSKLATGRGNLVKQSQALKKMGANTSKDIPAHLLAVEDA
ncbi:DNA recombination protein RmuC [Piscirickettsia litoralis]|uniref:Recombinase RmuC n=1 Tax=Piscirickettsia litoralis TaxID=1891921 RepID=A0ABX3A0J6_9GAMM|nr:DNA recombination protein RmuC [Piscirickettsia litoralis]ODN41973.1 recombinase RmuC [Piscirickettsia litoralis]